MLFRSEMIYEAFKNDKIRVFQDSEKLVNELLSMDWNDKNLLMMSSGNFDGVDYDDLAKRLFEKRD